MNPLLQQALDGKLERRKRLMELPYPEKVRIVERLREASIAARHMAGLQEISIRAKSSPGRN